MLVKFLTAFPVSPGLVRYFLPWCLLAPWASQVVPVVNNPPANAGDTRDEGSIPGSGRSPGVGNGDPLQHSFAWEIPWAEEPGELQSVAAKSQTQLSD